MNTALLLIPFALFGLFPLVSQLLAIALYRTNQLERLTRPFAWLRRLFPLFIVFDLFAQNRERNTVAHRWGYRLKKDGVTVDTGALPGSSEVCSFLDVEKLKSPPVVESVTSYLVNAVETTQDFDEFELTLASKPRPPIPSSVTGWFAHDEFVQAPLRERAVLTLELDS